MAVQLAPTIDSGEAILAVVGVRRLLDGSFKGITAEDWGRVRRLEKTVYAMARDLARENLDPIPFTPINYTQFLNALSTESDPDLIAKIVDSFPPEHHDAATAFLGQFGRALRFLRGKLPISTFKTLFGTQNLPPSETDVFAFEEVLEVIDNPLSVYGMVDSGRLTSEVALALMMIYPTLYGKVVGDIVVRCSTEKAATDFYEPHFEQALTVLLAVPGVDPSLKQQLAAPPPQAQQPQQQQPAQEPSSNSQAQKLAPASDKSTFND